MQVIRVLAMLDAVLEFHSVCSSSILRFEMRIAEKHADQDFALDVGQLQR
jgi:hypothetical protein